mmetsp:Transcript_25119/g.53349  ORF Transcript_25119/g.53349 Transcript_25119/m.53349 type:complete len:352 (-) Transcript_25119:1274-2329(-)
MTTPYCPFKSMFLCRSTKTTLLKGGKRCRSTSSGSSIMSKTGAACCGGGIGGPVFVIADLRLLLLRFRLSSCRLPLLLRLLLRLRPLFLRLRDRLLRPRLRLLVSLFFERDLLRDLDLRRRCLERLDEEEELEEELGRRRLGFFGIGGGRVTGIVFAAILCASSHCADPSMAIDLLPKVLAPRPRTFLSGWGSSSSFFFCSSASTGLPASSSFLLSGLSSEGCSAFSSSLSTGFTGCACSPSSSSTSPGFCGDGLLKRSWNLRKSTSGAGCPTISDSGFGGLMGGPLYSGLGNTGSSGSTIFPGFLDASLDVDEAAPLVSLPGALADFAERPSSSFLSLLSRSFPRSSLPL